MIGSLTIEKANFNISYMAASIYVLEKNGGRMSRADFVQAMANQMGCSPYNSDGKENRVPYNKTKFNRYFGFIDVDIASKDILLTPRGKRIAKFIVRDSETVNPNEMFDFAAIDRAALRELFLDSICFDTFGSFNCGAEESNSDIEPPKVILKLLYDVGPCTKQEIGYALWGLDGGVFSSWSDVVGQVKLNRKNSTVDYDSVIKSWGRQNFVDDFKLLELLSYKRIGLVDCSASGYSLPNDLSQEQRGRIASLSPFMSPIHLYLKGSCYAVDKNRVWIRESVLGRVACDGYIYYSDLEKDGPELVMDKFAKALVSAYRLRRYGVFSDKETKKTHWNGVVTFVIENVSSLQQLDAVFAPISVALERIQDFKANDHGWSKNVANDTSMFAKITSVLPSISQLAVDGIRIPSNLNIIGVCK